MFVQQLMNGFAMGSIYAIVAIGFVLIYKSTEVVNFAQGELMMVGAFITYTCVSYLQLSFWIALPITMVFMAAFGSIIERLVLRPLVGEAAFVIVMATIGLGIFLRSVAGMIWGYDTYSFNAGISDVPVQLGSFVLSTSQISVIGTTIILIICLQLFFTRTKMGISMEAVSQNQFAAFLMGIGVKKVFSRIWAISAIVATIGGILLTPIQFLNYNMGFIGLKAFPAAVLGGFGSIPGAIIGGIIIGISESLAGVYLNDGFKDIFAWLILIVVLLIKPEGIFGTHQQKRV